MLQVSEIIKKSISYITGFELNKINLETPEIPEHGDYSTNVALVHFDKNKWVSPREYAANIKDNLLNDDNLRQYISNIEVAGAGFINFWLSNSTLIKNLNSVVEDGDNYGKSNLGNGKTIIVEYSSPNIARRFAVGHLRSTIIGAAIRNIFDFLGYKTIGDNHLGDWGTQFGTIIARVMSKGLDVAKLSVSDYQKLYRGFNKEVEGNPELKKQAQLWFKKLEDGDESARKVWKDAVEKSMQEFNSIYEMLDVRIENAFGESFYEDKMPEVIEEIRKKGLSRLSDGAEIVEFESLPPAILLKSDKGTTYYTRDLACVLYRVREYNPQIIVYEVGAEQTLHFKQVFETARLMGWVGSAQLIHLAHGLFRFEGKKMSVRRGTDVSLEDILKESVERAKKIIEASETSRGLNVSDIESVARAIGIGAIKYFDLSHQPGSDIDFDWEDMFRLEGNSAPYLQYTYARCSSVLNKAGYRKANLKIKEKEMGDSEMVLARCFTQFQDVIVSASKMYSPNLICNYLFSLAQRFNNFYAKEKIIGSDYMDLRLALTAATAQILKNGLHILCIEVPQRM